VFNNTIFPCAPQKRRSPKAFEVAAGVQI
jgi:hypothetical protein